MMAGFQETLSTAMTSTCGFVCGHIFSSLGHIYLGVELLGSMLIFFFFLKQSLVLKSGCLQTHSAVWI